MRVPVRALEQMLDAVPVKRPEVELIIITADQSVEEAGVDSPESVDNVIVVNSPVSEGIALLRLPLAGPSRADSAEQALKATSCGPYTRSG